MNESKILKGATLATLSLMIRFGFEILNEQIESLEIKACSVQKQSSCQLSESSKRYQQYKLDNINDTHLRLMFDGCNKSIKYLDEGNYEMSLFQIRKVLEHILVLLITKNNLQAAKSYRSAKNFKICKKYHLIDDSTADAISKCRDICGDNTHQLGYEMILTKMETEAIVETTCNLLESITNIEEPIYQA